MKVEVIKIGKYDPTQSGRFSKYEGYCLSTVEEVDHPLSKEGEEIIEAHSSVVEQILYHSTLLRGVQTAARLPKRETSTVIPQAELNEVPFDLRKMLSEKEFNENGSNLVRARFVEAFIDNNLLETRQQIQDRLETVLHILKVSDTETATLVSHSFLMKMLESIVNDIDIFSNPDLLATVIQPNQKTYQFGEGFNFNL